MPLVPKKGRLVPVKQDAPDDQMYQMLSAPLEGDAEITSREKYRSYAQQKFGKDFSDVELDAMHNSVYGQDASYSSTITNLSNVYAVKSGGTVKNVPTVKSPTIGDYFRLATGSSARGWLSGAGGIARARAELSNKFVNLVGQATGENYAKKILRGLQTINPILGVSTSKDPEFDRLVAEDLDKRAKEGYEFWAGNVSNDVKSSIGGKAAGALGEIPNISITFPRAIPDF